MCADWNSNIPGSIVNGKDHSLSVFRNREQAFEIQFSHDEDLKFRARVRRNKLFGLWAAQKLGLLGEEAEHYAHDLAISYIRMTGDAALAKRVVDDLDSKGITVCDGEILATMHSLVALAEAQVRQEAVEPDPNLL